MSLDLGRKVNSKDLIFSLDIGTRTVIGLVGKYISGEFEIIDYEIKEHNKRNMYDGQIHDINGVAATVKEVKQALERKLNIELKEVAIAAAGRSLQTSRVRVDRNIDIVNEIDKRIIRSLELAAVQEAQNLIDRDYKKSMLKYYCIGYTVINYYLEDSLMENLEGHRGEKIGVDLLATFLPQMVIDSLYTVMDRVGLEVINITLEPIAAINVAIKKNLRLLNLALVDIGAGTSDIAITNDGTIVAYDMASIAGDEITEKIAKTYLLDFDSAEKLKVALNKKNDHVFCDILGIEHKLTNNEILSEIDEVIDELAMEISSRILRYNSKAPSAVFLIGGGSQIPGLSEKIAEKLKIPKERVAIRGTDTIEDIKNIPEELKGPHGITPLGIAINAINNRYRDFIEVTVNNEKVSIFNAKKVKVSDALILLRYNPRKLIPQRGNDFIYYINGEKKLIRGRVGEPAKIYVNGKDASLEYALKDGDNIKIIDATSGENHKPMLYECIEHIKEVNFNGNKINLVKAIKVNGIDIDKNIPINMNDYITIDEIKTISDLFKHMNISFKEYDVFLNGKKAHENSILNKGDIIIADLIKNDNQQNIDETIEVTINGKKINMKKDKEKVIFVDIFNYIDFDLSKPRGNLIMLLNGKNPKYTDELKDGDVIQVYWKDR